MNNTFYARCPVVSRSPTKATSIIFPTANADKTTHKEVKGLPQSHLDSPGATHALCLLWTKLLQWNLHLDIGMRFGIGFCKEMCWVLLPIQLHSAVCLQTTDGIPTAAKMEQLAWPPSSNHWMEAWAACSSTRSGGWWPCLWQRGWNLMILGVPSNPSHSMILWFISECKWLQIQHSHLLTKYTAAARDVKD